MSEHYFVADPQADEQRRLIEGTLRGHRLKFVTDTSVFSRKKLDFGTVLLAETVDIPPNARVLDLGCGYGPLGVAIAKSQPNCWVVMVDINKRAVELARESLRLNDVVNAEVFQSDGYEKVRGQFDVIVSNPPYRAGKKVVYSLFEESINYLQSGGSLYIVIRKKQGGESAIKKLTEVFGNCEKVQKKGGYWILKSTLND